MMDESRKEKVPGLVKRQHVASTLWLVTPINGFEESENGEISLASFFFLLSEMILAKARWSVTLVYAWNGPEHAVKTTDHRIPV